MEVHSVFSVRIPPHLTLSLLLLYRAKFVRISLFLLACLIFIVFLSAQFSGRHPATLALDIGISIIKIFIPVLFAIFIQELVVKESEKRNDLQSLAYPHNRYGFFLNRWLAGLIAVFIFYCIAALLLAGVAYIISSGYEQSTPIALDQKYWLVVIFGLFDIVVVSTIAAFLSVIAKSPGFVLIGTLGITIVARSYSSILYLLSGDMLVVDDPEKYQGGLNLISYIVPDLGALDIRQISLYNDWGLLPHGLFEILLSPIVFSIALLSLSALLFKSRSVA